MVWGGITYNRKTPLIQMEKGKRKAEDFVRQVYGPVLLGFYNSLENPVLMEDNAPVHTAKIAEAWRKEKGLKKLSWPAQSPDLNPIENLWFQIKSELKISEERLGSMKDLGEVIEDVWNYISIEKVNKLIDSMPRRIKEVIKAKGGPTRW